jgi:3D (Asp-Asp-Asp) domain-containing protein
MIRIFFGCALLVFALMQCGCVGIRPPAGSVMVERRMLTTGYCKCGKCCGWERQWWWAVDAAGREKKVGFTASGARARYGTIAADTTQYPFGTVMYIPGYGYGRVEDRGRAIKGEHVDLFFGSHGTALKWGKRWRDVKVWLKGKIVR